MPGQKDIFTPNARTEPGTQAEVNSNKVIRAFKIDRYLDSKIPSGIKYPKTFRDEYTYEKYNTFDPWY